MKIKNFIGRFKGYSGCSHCGGTWNWKENKTIPYREKISSISTADTYSGMFPVCKECFERLSEDKILQYCKLLLDDWISHGCNSCEIIENYKGYVANLKNNITKLKAVD